MCRLIFCSENKTLYTGLANHEKAVSRALIEADGNFFMSSTVGYTGPFMRTELVGKYVSRQSRDNLQLC